VRHSVLHEVLQKAESDAAPELGEVKVQEQARVPVWAHAVVPGFVGRLQ
jgi:hypothetical protein